MKISYLTVKYPYRNVLLKVNLNCIFRRLAKENGYYKCPLNWTKTKFYDYTVCDAVFLSPKAKVPTKHFLIKY